MIFGLLILLNGEFFQNQLHTFSSNYYFVDYAYSKGEDRSDLTNDIKNVCRKYSVDAFAVKKTNDGIGKYNIEIYGNENVYKEIKGE